MLDAIAFEHQYRQVGADEYHQKQQHHGLGQHVQGAGVGQGDGHRRRGEDGHARGLPPRQHLPEHPGQQPLAGHAIGQAAGHDHGQQSAVGHRDQGDDREQPGRHAQARSAEHVHQRRARRLELVDRQHQGGTCPYQQVDDAGDDQGAEQGARIDATHVPHLFSQVGRGLETDEGIEGQQRRTENGHGGGRRIHFQQARRLGLPLGDEPGRRRDDDHQA